ncbi:2-hydroxyacid dehydrogenase [Qingshengfaniella alkalisoli]|uniref:Glyoxylate/hydroxypyruvate reductase A n=1 Tax=Qingshengfaniella alkalisoli TaxID=2599296 RepID=A0A5B8IUJ0_9RHOB|nr:glyoxylate/hydroxypyruvate reductase A [Qingshengfaniella alkalisoli]QDY69093.1 glyoxylate/hydroxypyruvate reductase A [Qingshengfaniella alkalisoli]
MSHSPIAFLASADEGNIDLWLTELRARMPDEDIRTLEELSDAERVQCDIAIVAQPTPDMLDAVPNVTWIHSLWAGVDSIRTVMEPRGTPVVRLVDPQLAETMAEAVLAWVMYLHRDMPAYARQQRAHEWKKQPYCRASDRTVAILGLGALGQTAARRLAPQGFRLKGWSRSAKSIDGMECFHGDDGLVAAVTNADIVVSLLPLTPDTCGVIDQKILGAFKQSAGLINFGRGPVIDEVALRQALGNGSPGHAVLDVFAQEPLPSDNWMWDHPAVTILPHISAPTDSRTASAIVSKAIARFRATGEIPEAVDWKRGY